ncbi:3-isopropylmalate dehydratase [bacterium CG2_30_54_10]|nr:MAG: 3-isopropylmalate dehydratase [bacterium CG2_30_54_10]
MQSRPTLLKGRVYLVADKSGRPIDNIDTDMIFHNAHLAITDLNEMGPHAFGNLQGFEDFSKKVKVGDILLLGKNFGAGSSRQQAVDCFIALGVQALVAESFGAIYKRNAINSGLPILAHEGFAGVPGAFNFASGDQVEINLEKSTISNLTRAVKIHLDPFGKVQMDIYNAGGLYSYGKMVHSQREGTILG